jgi:MFS family permease
MMIAALVTVPAVRVIASLIAMSVGRPLVGRWADRHGLLPATLLLLLVAIPLTIVIPWIGNRWLLSVVLVFAVSTYGCLWGPPIALLSHSYDEAGVARVFAFALVGLTIGVGFFVGSAVGGVIARLAGDAAAYALPAAACAVAWLVLATRRIFPGLALQTESES